MQIASNTIWPRLARPIRFGTVGASGFVVNSAVLWALVRGLGAPLLLGSALATEVAIVTNFLLNDRWTFRSDRSGSPARRLLRFNGVALGGMAITAGVLFALSSYARLPLLLANLLAVGVAMVWNYVANSRWTWGREAGVRYQESGDRRGVQLNADSVVVRRSSVVGEEVDG